MTISSKNNIIVSADDFGIRDVAASILPLAQAGKLDRVSVLVNYVKSKDEAAALVATGVKIDLHLELIELIKSGENPEESAWFRAINFVVRYVLGRVPQDTVERMWTDQITLFKELFGRYPDGLNSHEHIHYFPRFFRLAVALGKRYRIPFIRFGRKGILSQPGSSVSGMLSMLWKWNVFRDADISLASSESSDFFVSYDWIRDLDVFLENLPEGDVEIVFHPERAVEYAVAQNLSRAH